MLRFTRCLTVALSVVGWESVRGALVQNASPPQRVIEGRVVDAALAPVADASVVLRADDDVMLPNGVIAHTGADGRYSADVSKYEWATSKLRCRALASGFAYATRSLEAGSGRATVDFTLKPEPWRTAEVRLADPAGQPGADVTVTCLIDDLPWQTVKTDEAGRCVLYMPIGQGTLLDVRPRASRAIRAILLNTKGAPAKVVLPLLGPIAGRIHDKAGRPLAGIAVGRLIDEGEKGLEVSPHFFSETVTTGPDGKFAYAPTLMLKDRNLEGRPDRKRLPSSICFADQSCTRVAFGMVDMAGPVEPLDITLEAARLVRIPIELETVRASADAIGNLTVFLQPRRDIPDFREPVLSRRLLAQNLTGSGHVVVGLPAGDYVVTADCFTKDYKRTGKAEGKLVVPPGEGPIDSPAIRVEAPLQQKMAGKPAPQIDATDLDTGKPVRLADFLGKVVVLDFWGYWCGPCTSSMPDLAALHRKFAGRPVAVVALHDQSVQSRAEYDRRIAFARKAYWNSEDLPFRVLLDRPDPEKPHDRDPEGTGVTCKRYGIVVFPSVFVIDQEGKIVAPVRHSDHAELDRLIEGLLDKGAAGDAKKK